MQADSGLAGTGRALDTQRGVQRRAYETVLLGLDRRDDVAHRPRTGSLDFGDKEGVRSAGDPSPGKQLVIVGRQFRRVREPEPPPHPDTATVLTAGAVERGRHRSTPIDHHRPPGGIVYVAAANVDAVHGGQAGSSGAWLVHGTWLEVEPPE